MDFGLKLLMYAALKHVYIGVFWWMSWTSHFIFQPSARLSALLAQAYSTTIYVSSYYTTIYLSAYLYKRILYAHIPKARTKPQARNAVGFRHPIVGLHARLGDACRSGTGRRWFSFTKALTC